MDNTKMRKRCPQCGCTRFMVSSVRVAQDWLVDSAGEKLRCINAEAEILHTADDSDEWICYNCNSVFKGSSLNISETELIKSALYQIRGIASDISNFSPEARQIQELASRLLTEVCKRDE